MLKVVVKDRCVLKKWLYIYLSIYIIGHHHVKSSFGANKVLLYYWREMAKVCNGNTYKYAYTKSVKTGSESMHGKVCWANLRMYLLCKYASMQRMKLNFTTVCILVTQVYTSIQRV